MFKFVVIATCLAVAACGESGLYPGGYQQRRNVLRDLEGFENYEQGSPRQSYNPADLLQGYSYISLLNRQNEPVGYIYSLNSEIASQQERNIYQLRDEYGNLLGYYSRNLLSADQVPQYVPLNQNDLYELSQFGFTYVPQGVNNGFFVLRNLGIFRYIENGVLSLRSQYNWGYEQSGRRYNYPQQYQGPYAPQYQGPYEPQYQGPYGPQYQGPYGPQYQGQYGPQYQGPQAPLYPGQYGPYQRYYY